MRQFKVLFFVRMPMKSQQMAVICLLICYCFAYEADKKVITAIFDSFLDKI